MGTYYIYKWGLITLLKRNNGLWLYSLQTGKSQYQIRKFSMQIALKIFEFDLDSCQFELVVNIFNEIPKKLKYTQMCIV